MTSRLTLNHGTRGTPHCVGLSTSSLHQFNDVKFNITELNLKKSQLPDEGKIEPDKHKITLKK